MGPWRLQTEFSRPFCTIYSYQRKRFPTGHFRLLENVVCNVKNPMKHLCQLTERYPEVQFVFDTKMAAFHGELELLYQPEYAWLWQEGHIRHYHVNDYGGGYMEWGKLKTLPIGAGHVDFEKFFAFVRGTGYQGTFTVEATAFDRMGVVDTEMLYCITLNTA